MTPQKKDLYRRFGALPLSSRSARCGQLVRSSARFGLAGIPRTFQFRGQPGSNSLEAENNCGASPHRVPALLFPRWDDLDVVCCSRASVAGSSLVAGEHTRPRFRRRLCSSWRNSPLHGGSLLSPSSRIPRSGLALSRCWIGGIFSNAALRQQWK